MEEIYKRFSKDRFSKLCGIIIDDIKLGYAKTSVMVKEQHLNGVDITQGGLVYTLADLAFACASNSYGPIAVGLNTNISFLKPTTAGHKLTAIAKVDSLTRKTCTVTVEVFQQEELIAKMLGTAYVKG
ncbi:MAG: hotdog fold thioesterase [Clostridiales bacterium]|nr:hotdog fold thioesterase [Clostridiales bacterium]